MTLVDDDSDIPAPPQPPPDFVSSRILGDGAPGALDPLWDWFLNEIQQRLGTGCIMHVLAPRRMGLTQMLLKVVAMSPDDVACYSIDDHQTHETPAALGLRLLEVMQQTRRYPTWVSYSACAQQTDQRMSVEIRKLGVPGPVRHVSFERSTRLRRRSCAAACPLVITDRCHPARDSDIWHSEQTLILAGFGGDARPIPGVLREVLVAHQRTTAMGTGNPYTFRLVVYEKTAPPPPLNIDGACESAQAADDDDTESDGEDKDDDEVSR